MKITQLSPTHWRAEVSLPVGRRGLTILGYGHTETWAIHRADQSLLTAIETMKALDRYDLMPAWQACRETISAAYQAASGRSTAAHAPTERTIS